MTTKSALVICGGIAGIQAALDLADRNIHVYVVDKLPTIGGTMCMLDIIRAKRDEIYAIAKKHKAEKLWVFGSTARKEDRPDSDADFLVQFGDDATMLSHVRMQRELAGLLNRDVDIVSHRCVSDYPMYNFSAEVKRDMVPV